MEAKTAPQPGRALFAAATAIEQDAPLLTADEEDFKALVPLGLKPAA